MNIVYFSAVYPPYICGVSIVTQQLAEYFARKKHRVMVITTSLTGKAKTQKKGRLIIHYAPSITISRKHSWYIPRPPIKWLKTTLAAFKPDIIHLHDPSALVLKPFQSIKALTAPIIISHHFTPEYILTKSRLTKPLTKSIKFKQTILEKAAAVYNQCHTVAVPNPLIAQQLKKAGVNIPITVISNGVNLQRFHPQHRRITVLSKFHLDPQLPTFIFSGRLEPDKNLNLLIRAFAAAARHKPVKQLLIIGQGSRLKALKLLARELKIAKNIAFAGKINYQDSLLPQLYASGYALINPSIIENQSLTSLEMLASGLPVITTNTVGQKILIRNRVNGFLLAPKVSDFSQAIQILASQPQLRSKMSAAARQSVLKHDLNHSFDQMEKLYYRTNKSISK